jgi:hypothetical protein
MKGLGGCFAGPNGAWALSLPNSAERRRPDRSHREPRNGAASTAILSYASFTVDGVGQNGGLPSAWNAVGYTAGAHLTILEFE